MDENRALRQNLSELRVRLEQWLRPDNIAEVKAALFIYCTGAAHSGAHGHRGARAAASLAESRPLGDARRRSL